MNDNIDYWIDRHEKYRNRLCSVGSLLRTEAENMAANAIEKKRTFDVLRRLGLTDLRGKAVLDAGCGIGLTSELFWMMGAEVHGVDCSKVAIEQARLRAPGGVFQVMLLPEMNLGRTFDIVYCADVLYHILDQKAWQCSVDGLARHLKPGGYLIVLECLQLEEHMPVPHVRRRTTTMYQEVIEKLGLAPIDTGGPEARVLVFHALN